MTLYEVEMINFFLNISFIVLEQMSTKSASLLPKVSLLTLRQIPNQDKIERLAPLTARYH